MPLSWTTIFASSRILSAFTRDSARWSADSQNIERYLSSGNCMSDVIDKPIEQAVGELPLEERVYTGSGHHSPSWPYEQRN